jgi:hypothetical protein
VVQRSRRQPDKSKQIDLFSQNYSSNPSRLPNFIIILIKKEKMSMLLNMIRRTFFVSLKYETVNNSLSHSAANASGAPVGVLVYTVKSTGKPLAIPLLATGTADIPTPKAGNQIYFVPHPTSLYGARVEPNSLSITLGEIGVGGLSIVGH